jgi:Zn2+/Cd2+-exporting ATPase
MDFGIEWTFIVSDLLTADMEKTAEKNPVAHDRHDHDGHEHDHDHAGTGGAGWRAHWDLLLGLLILLVLVVLRYGFNVNISEVPLITISLVAYFLAGREVLDLAFRKAKRGDIFNEFVLMSIATIGAFVIGSYEEGVAVMVFYQIGEWFQDAAVDKAKRNIKALLDIRPDKVTVIKDGKTELTTPDKVATGAIIQVKAGEKVALDGRLISDKASFNTAALTGESRPDTKCSGDPVFAGMINLNTVAEIQVTAAFKDSKLSRILELVQDATSRKSQTQLFISKFAGVYTPIVFFLALAVCLLPALFVRHYEFYTWFYRALVFLVISCPCALVISIPLGYFGGIGLASRNGILFKGGNFLDVMTRIDTMVMDKTGTLTKGVFSVQQVICKDISEKELVGIAVRLEKKTTHPVAKAIIAYAGEAADSGWASHVEEIAGLGLKGSVDAKTVLAGNTKLLDKFNIQYPDDLKNITDTIVIIAVEGEYRGHFIIADELKDDSAAAIEELRKLNVRSVMLSGDKQSVVDKVKKALNIDEAYGDLLPEDKVDKVKALKNHGKRIAFAGDGVNDAPVVALADAGIAMGGLGSDATIEIADIVIQNDQPMKIVSAIRIGKITKTIVWQNIVLAMTVKVFVLILGAGGIANLWEAVIADVGVALLAILNAVRIQSVKV